MAWFLKALLGTGVVASASTVAIVSSKSLWNGNPSSSIVQKNENTLSASSQVTSREITNLAVDSPESPAVKTTTEKDVIAKSPETSLNSHTSSAGTTSKVLSENEKLQARALNDDLCRNVANWSYGQAYLRVCKAEENSTNMEFQYFDSKYSMPIKIKHLKFTIRDIVITLEKANEYGYTVLHMDLPSGMLSGTGLFSSFANGKEFAHNSCTLNDATVRNTDWKIKC